MPSYIWSSKIQTCCLPPHSFFSHPFIRNISSLRKMINDKREKSRHFTFPPLAMSLMLGLCHTFARPVPLAVPGCHNQLEARCASLRKVYFEARNAGTNSQLVENHIPLLNPENPAQHECCNTQRSVEIYNSEFHCGGGEKKIVSLNKALQTERGDWLEKQPETQKCNYWGKAMDWNQTPWKKYSGMFCNWVSHFFLRSLKPFKRAYTLRIRNTFALWKTHLWKVLQIRHQKSLVIIQKALPEAQIHLINKYNARFTASNYLSVQCHLYHSRG